MLVWSADVYNIVYSASVEVLLQILWLSIVCTLLGYYAWTYSVGYFWSYCKASFFLFLIPVFSIIIGLYCISEGSEHLYFGGGDINSILSIYYYFFEP